VRLREGMVLRHGDVLALRALIPEEIWRTREVFFHEGMRMEIGACHRRYQTAADFEEATRKFAGQATLDREGNLESYRAGLPFPPDQIDPEAADAGARWAWNLEHRYRAGGPRGEFRLVDMPARVGGAQTYTGSFFFLQTRNRTDLAATDYAVPEADDRLWVAGGRFEEPFHARHLAWKQMRPLETLGSYGEPDDTFVYVPTMRKVRRAATPWVDGVFMPRYRVSGDSGGGGLPIGEATTGAQGGVNPTAAESIAVTENLRRGFTGLALRPNAYVWRLVEEREVLAPINSAHPGYPAVHDRNYGYSGLSVGTERWDVRWVVVVEGAARMRGRDFDRITIYIDYQTQQPLFVVTRRHSGRLVDVGILVHRYSGDIATYPRWPDGERARVFDPVGAFFYDAADGGSGWRRESYGVTSTPMSDEDFRKYTSTSYLSRGK
jgi:hypothetical protein